MKQVIFLMMALVLSVKTQKILKDIPIIGILTQPRSESLYGTEAGAKEFIDAHYPIYLGGAGATVVPISYKLSETELRELMKKLNGVLFTGGTTAFSVQNNSTKEWSITPFGQAAKNIVNIATELNDAGKYFPIWGTCMGFQLLAFIISEDPKIPNEGCDCVNYNAELIFASEGKTSKMFSHFTKEEIKDFEEKNLTFNYHRYYVATSDFIKHKKLEDFFNIIAYSWDIPKSMRFIAAMEAKKYPIYGTQFHPEVNQYTTTKRIPGPKNVELAQKFANFFVNEARKNDNNMTRQELLKRVIWNTPIVRTKGNSFIYEFS